MQSTGCAGEKTGHILAPEFSTKKCTGGIDLPVEKGCANTSGGDFSPDPERVRPNVPGILKPAAGTAARRAGSQNRPHPQARAGYDSPVCSTTGDAIDRIAAAIDQLASDARSARGTAGESELTARVAALWLMVSDLDPELARRTLRYAAPEGGAPSS
jgi:hypothetical protein